MAVGFDIFTNLPPQQVSRIAVEIFSLWVDFALGRASIGGKKLIYPTGRYAASISYHFTGESSVAFVATAPEADILEHGHPSIDLKQKLRPGHYLMHRTGPGKPSMRSSRGSGLTANVAMWAKMREQSASGFATLGPNSPPGSWIIPAMPAYSTAAILAAQARSMAARMG
jgi:hypothetical protein